MLKQNELPGQPESMTLEEKRTFLKLPLEERRRILSQQAEDAARHYESEPSVEREAWQGGDIVAPRRSVGV